MSNMPDFTQATRMRVRKFVHISSIIMMFVSGLLLLLGIISLPAEGLMFGLPFFFLFPGAVLGLIGGLLFFFSRSPSEKKSDEQRNTR
jgi:hypothetical protein